MGVESRGRCLVLGSAGPWTHNPIRAQNEASFPGQLQYEPRLKCQQRRSRQVWLRILSFLYWVRDGHCSVEVLVLACAH